MGYKQPENLIIPGVQELFTIPATTYLVKIILEDGELDQLVKCLLHKPRHLNSDQHPHKSWPI